MTPPMLQPRGPASTRRLRRGGFIALISAIIISAILLVVTVSGSLTGIYARTTVLESEYKERSSALAEACVDEAILKLALDSSYTGTVPSVNVGANTCSLTVAGTSPKTITTQGIFQNSYTKLQIQGTAGGTGFTITDWREIP